MKKSNVKLLLVGACVLGALGMAGCGKKNYDTFPEKYSLASVDVGGMTAKEAKKAVKDAVKKYQIAVKLDDASFDMNADELGLEYNDKTDMQMLINAANKDEKTEKKVELFKTKNAEELESALVDSYITAKTQEQSDAAEQSADDSDTDKKQESETTQDSTGEAQTFDIRTIQP